ncbi:MAG: hypothetical protein EPN97_14745 [Alphaproteobacteria bacterium]|nr:MAG: hypothetical protein EPN97_14745 [Alphaproteobacteria bacterium]
MKKSILSELHRGKELSPYESFDATWTVIVKIANHLSKKAEEFERLSDLFRTVSDATAAKVLSLPAVDQLLDLDPPLEEVQSGYEHERLNPKLIERKIALIRASRTAKPSIAFIEMMSILKRIRNRRAHGFKSPDNARDVIILKASATILHALGTELANGLT